MADTRRANRALEAHLAEVIGVDDAVLLVADRFEQTVTADVLDRALERALRQQTAYLIDVIERQGTTLREEMRHQVSELREEMRHEASESRTQMRHQGADLRSEWRRDLLLVSGTQFFTLAAAVAAFLGLS